MGAWELRDATGEDWPWIVARHVALYRQELGWDGSFEPVVQRAVDAYLANHSPRQAAWVAHRGGARIGSVVCAEEDAQSARLRLLLVEPEFRGQRLGEHLVDRCVAFARDAGYRSIRLWTTDALVAAQRLYSAAGFTEVTSAPVRQFGHDMTDRTLELTLA